MIYRLDLYYILWDSVANRFQWIVCLGLFSFYKNKKEVYAKKIRNKQPFLLMLSVRCNCFKSFLLHKPNSGLIRFSCNLNRNLNGRCFVTSHILSDLLFLVVFANRRRITVWWDKRNENILEKKKWKQEKKKELTKERKDWKI